jgi:hypothetical protein
MRHSASAGRSIPHESAAPGRAPFLAAPIQPAAVSSFASASSSSRRALASMCSCKMSCGSGRRLAGGVFFGFHHVRIAPDLVGIQLRLTGGAENAIGRAMLACISGRYPPVRPLRAPRGGDSADPALVPYPEPPIGCGPIALATADANLRSLEASPGSCRFPPTQCRCGRERGRRTLRLMLFWA